MLCRGQWSQDSSSCLGSHVIITRQMREYLHDPTLWPAASCPLNVAHQTRKLDERFVIYIRDVLRLSSYNLCTYIDALE